jgi:hypothetical protein
MQNNNDWEPGKDYQLDPEVDTWFTIWLLSTIYFTLNAGIIFGFLLVYASWQILISDIEKRK